MQQYFFAPKPQKKDGVAAISGSIDLISKFDLTEQYEKYCTSTSQKLGPNFQEYLMDIPGTYMEKFWILPMSGCEDISTRNNEQYVLESRATTQRAPINMMNSNYSFCCFTIIGTIDTSADNTLRDSLFGPQPQEMDHTSLTPSDLNVIFTLDDPPVH